MAKNVAKFESGSYAGPKYYTVLNSSLIERVDQINSNTVKKQETETFEVKNPKPSKSSKQGKPSAPIYQTFIGFRVGLKSFIIVPF